jgi:hypothetical protein
MINDTQWSIYRKVSKLATDADDKVFKLEPCTDEWQHALGYASALRQLAIDLLSNDFIAKETESDLVASHD